MTYIIGRIREYMKRKAVRARLRKAVSVLCCIVVFVTTYALMLPSLALEKEAICGEEEHEHTDDCYTRELVCGQEESEDHQHTDACYEDVLSCGKEVHIHTEDCYPREEFEEEPEETVREEAQENSQEESARKEVEEIEQEEPEESVQEGAVETIQKEPAETADDEKSEESAQEKVDDDGQEQDADQKAGADEGNDADDDSESAAKSGKSSEDAEDESEPADSEKNDFEKEGEESTAAAEPDKLDKIDFEKFLTDDTDIYYLPEGGDDDEWKPIDENVKLNPEEVVLLHIAFEIPAGKINATNAETEYYLSTDIELSDELIDDVNRDQNTVFEGTDRTSDDLMKAGEYEIGKKTDDKGEITELKLMIRFNDYAAKKIGGEKLVDGEETAKPEKIEGFFELSVSASDLLGLKKEGDAAYKMEWNDDSDLDTTICFDKEKLDAYLLAKKADGDKAADGQAYKVTASGETYEVILTYSDGSGLPAEGVTLSVSEIAPKDDGYDDYLTEANDAVGDSRSVSNLKLFDIKILVNDKETEPTGPVNVLIKMKDVQAEENEDVQVLHFQEEGETEVLDSEDVQILTPQEEGKPEAPESETLQTGLEGDEVSGVSFTTDGFSVYGIVYTVDFHWEADGKVYDFGIPGGGFISLSQMVEALEISQKDQNGVVVCAETEEFIGKVADVEFSSPELVWVGKAEEDITVGELKENNSLECEYSVDLTQEQIKEINAQTVSAGDWALISLRPFLSEEELTVTLTNGDRFVIRVTDAQITEMVMSASGETYKITVTYDRTAGIPDGAKLEAEEILPETEAQDAMFSYDEYVRKTAEALGWKEENPSYIRLFDIRIVDADGEKVEITAPVDVRIELADKERSEDTKVVHFADGAENGDVVGEIETEGTAVNFAAEGFSAYAIVEGPIPSELGWSKVTSLSELDNTGFYIGHVDGYYLKDTINSENNRLGIEKTRQASTTPTSEAVLYYFEKAAGTDDQFYVYCKDGNNKKYVYNGGDNNLSFAENESQKTAFTISVNSSGVFEIRNAGQTESWYWNMQGGTTGKRFCSWNKSDDNTKLYIWNQRKDVTDDPYELNGKTSGLMNWNGGVSGRAMMAGDQSYIDVDAEQTVTVPDGALGAMPLTVMTKQDDHTTKLFVPQDMLHYNVSTWTFEWSGEDDLYYLKSDGKYLTIGTDGLSLQETRGDNCKIQVVPGTGVHEGQIILRSTDGITLTYSGDVTKGFNTGGQVGNEYLYLVDPRENTQGYVMTYSASKVSVSDPSVTTGKQVVVYTRFWVDGEGDQSGHYDYYAINSKGQLIRCYERGDSIEWVGGADNDMLWQFTQYCYDDGSWKPYCELENTTSHKFIAPSVSNDSILSDSEVGIILPGRRNGQYYTPILTWDQEDYHYSGMKPASATGGSGTQVIPCSIWDAEDFYFAVMEDIPLDDKLNTVTTIDNDLYGITMRMVNLENAATNDPKGEMNAFFHNTTNNGLVTTTVPGLLSTDLKGGEHGYPTGYGGSLATLFDEKRTRTVNHLFIESTYHASGYFEYDSTQNFASLNNGNNFTVYKELGTTDQNERDTLKHGQFFPYDEIEAGRFAAVNKENLFTPATNGYLPDTDPRKHEQLYLIKNKSAEYYFGMELDAGFDQTPSGEDAWGHDIIFEFSGDDDFWLYVDGELVIDLGGIHSAVPGSVNFKTGKVNVNGRYTTLYQLFHDNYIQRGMSEEAARKKLLGDESDPENYPGIFTGENGVFRDNTPHTMRIFYFERGAGASNLHMRFNLATVRKGAVQLTKKLGGLDTTESSGAKFAYQIKYRKADGSEHYLTNTPQHEENGGSGESGENGAGESGSGEGSGSGAGESGSGEGGGSGSGESGSGEGGPDWEDPDLDPYDRVCYKDTHNPVEFKDSVEIDGVTYENVFFIVPGDKGTADITFPNDMVDYRIIECGVNTDIYYQVKVNDVDITGSGNQEYSPGQTYKNNRKDFGIEYAATDARPKVEYENYPHKQNLQIRKRLYFRREGADPVEAQGEERLTSASFNFRLYFGTEFDDNPDDPAYIYEYHVKDTNGDYCRRDKETNGKFVPIDPGKAYDQLTPDQKRLATFDSGTGGSISEIPAYYTVEIRDVLVGSPYRIAELDNETADGFEYWRYAVEKYVDEPGEGSPKSPSQNDGVTDTIENGKTSLVYVDNLKGFGLRLNKVWADANDMKDRDSTFFAVFIQGENEQLTYVPDSLKELSLKDIDGNVIEQTLYWFYEELPQGAENLSDLLVREVIPPETAGGEPTPIKEGEPVVLNGTHTHSETEESIIYKVTYDKPVTKENVRTFGVTDTPEKQFIVLKKMRWDGETPLAGAAFTLSAGSQSSEYTSGSDGGITILYPMTGTEYTLTETSAPSAWQGLAYPIHFSVDQDGEVTVTTENGTEWYTLTQMSDSSPAMLIVKDRPYTLKAVKKDGQTGSPLKDVSFELFHYISTATGYDFSPMGGEYTDLKTDENGLIPKIDEELPAGIYQLRERTPQGYQPLSQQGDEYTSYITFRISGKGVVTLTDNNPEGISLSSETDDTTGTMAYTLTILNYPQIKIRKTDENGQDLKGAKFRLNRLTNNSVWEVYNGGGITNGVIDLTAGAGKMITYLPDGRYQLVEEKAPDGYIIQHPYVYFTAARVEGQQLIWLTDENGSRVAGEEEGTYSNTIDDATLDTGTNLITITIINHPGAALPSSGGPGTRIFLVLGTMLLCIAGTLLAGRRILTQR